MNNKNENRLSEAIMDLQKLHYQETFNFLSKYKELFLKNKFGEKR